MAHAAIGRIGCPAFPALSIRRGREINEHLAKKAFGEIAKLCLRTTLFENFVCEICGSRVRHTKFVVPALSRDPEPQAVTWRASRRTESFKAYAAAYGPRRVGRGDGSGCLPE